MPKLETRIVVPTGGWTITTADTATPGGYTPVLPAGDYYLSSTAPGGSVSFLAQVGTTLSHGGLIYTATLDDTTDVSTGKVTISQTNNPATFTLSWPNTTLRDLLGFTGTATSTTIGGHSDLVAPKQVRYLWLPSTQRQPAVPDPVFGEGSQDFGVPETDYIVTTAPSGATTRTVFSTRRTERLVFDPLRGSKTWLSNEVVANESFECFWLDLMAEGGAPFRYHSDRNVDATYWTMVFDQDAARLGATPTVKGWVGPASLWHLEMGVKKYVVVNGR